MINAVYCSVERSMLKALGRYSTMSLAIKPSSDKSAAARSPARPWRYTPSRTATSGVYVWAKSERMMPVSTSPEPAVAMPGLPVGLKYTFPSGVTMAVYAPLMAMYSCCLTASSRVRSSSSYELRVVLMSPKSSFLCGVRMVRLGNWLIHPLCEPRMLSASASMTTLHLEYLTCSINACTV